MSESLFNGRLQNSEAELAVLHDRDILRWKDDYFAQRPHEWIIDERDASEGKVVYVRQPKTRALIVSLLYEDQASVSHEGHRVKRDNPHAEASKLRDILIERYFYNELDITSILEGISPPELTTKGGLLEQMRLLVSSASASDRFVFYFSGRATQVYTNFGEMSRGVLAETLLPTDYQYSGYIYEQDIHEALVVPIQAIDCKLTVCSIDSLFVFRA